MTDSKATPPNREERTWTCAYVCRECGHRGTTQVPRGHTSPTGMECPNCGNCYCLIFSGDPKTREPHL